MDADAERAVLRATEEWKSADVSRRCTEGTCLVLSTTTAIREFSRRLHRAEFSLTPRESLRFAWSDAADLVPIRWRS